MSWDAIGAIGQAISAVAVVVTLAFLVVQLRQLAAQTQQNSHAIRFATYSAQANQLSGWQHATALDADLSRILMEAAKATQYGTPALRGWWQREREAGAYIPEFIAAIDAHEPAIRGEYLLKR